MKVRATQLGYYGHARRRPGDIFEVENEKQFSKKWMERLDARGPELPQQENAPVLKSAKPTGAREVI